MRQALGSWCTTTSSLETVNTPGNCSVPTGNRTALCFMPFEESRVSLVVVYSAVCVLGLPANCLTAGLTLLQALQGSVLAVYLFCLALCELLYASTLPLWVIYVQNGHCWDLGEWACKVTAYIFFCNLYVSILFLCCISCDRYVAVAYALESRGHRRQRTAVLVSAFIFLLVGLAHYPVFTMQLPERTCFEVLPMDGTVANYFYSRFAMGFALPLAIIIFTNHGIFRGIKQSAGLGAAQKARVRRTVLAVVVIFLACFAPYHLVLLAKAAAFSYHRGEEGPMCTLECQVYTASIVCLCLATVNSVADPIIYVLATDNSRQEVSRICSRWQKWSTKTEVTKSTWSKDSEEAQLPTLLINSCQFPRPVQPPGSQPGTWAPLGTLERLSEGSC
ncbi:probable G-protein coupled receptor 132 isoform X2 [Artibeus jamaicensis]|nr:probable G-protein coupled receptor 132 isoform X2 [Artibeus jamaicensis]XP_053522137.1 probable G-protein coupled receptor 132 isoform X2 [Artibeus jamaicensis]XP_053522138.1 probable G-protein coupled receptor 132 isoform X2 [Artibeus jamaicensis]XP_053522139.1 probable G-protein coupled receptor 132 isoform X2 [Artibeus jamaicensis]XP_053522140.1 probable G-protein coupled receptor 132 isoform X2 [Artibeus jamaicensis]XP_053522141.1 probable G-protein coupled receptor 132 isoform X2 [Art